MIRAGHELKNMKHGDLHRIALTIMAGKRLDLDFTTVDEFIDFRTAVEREERAAYERSERLRKDILAESDPANPDLLEWIRASAEHFREQNEANRLRRERRVVRERARALERAEWLKQQRTQKNGEVE
jgi:galactokinase